MKNANCKLQNEDRVATATVRACDSIDARNAVQATGNGRCGCASAATPARLPFCIFQFAFFNLHFPSRTISRRAQSVRGFTLLEVILALTILAGVLAVLGEVGRLALRNAANARDLAKAQLLAESKLAEIETGLAGMDSTTDEPFDPEAASRGLKNTPLAGWLYSIDKESTDEEGLLSIRVTVRQDRPAAQHPVKFSLVRWLPDPDYTSVTATNEQNSAASSSSSSESGSGSGNNSSTNGTGTSGSSSSGNNK
jgi:prepilin-type N-terminal cleavage/methylation domain-containing protein